MSCYQGAEGKPVVEDFEYSSNNNSQWIGVDQLKRVIADRKVNDE